jgi:hypothetical protein
MKQYKEILNTSYAKFYTNNEIFIVEYPRNLEINKKEALQIVKDRLRTFENKKYPLLIDGRKLKSIDKEARSYFASDEAITGIKAAALLANSIFTTYIGNFFISVTVVNPKIPTKLFTDKKKAIKWLEQYKD